MSRDRWSRLAALLAEAGLEALVVVARDADDPFLAPFLSGGHLRRSWLVAPRGRPPRLGYATPMERDEAAASGLGLLTPEQLDTARWARGGAPPDEVTAGVVARALQLCEVPPGRVGLAGLAESGWMLGAARRLEAEGGWRLEAGEPVVERLRRRKSPEELAEIRGVCCGVGEAFRRVAGLLAAAEEIDGSLWLEGERLRVGRLRAEIARVFLDRGLVESEGNIVAPGRDGAVPHSVGADEQVLRPGEPVVVDLFPRRRLFADATRTFCVGPVPEALRGAHEVVRRALEAARRETAEGVRGWELTAVVSETFEAAGFPTARARPGTERGFVHGLGHGVGFELHEAPSFRENAVADGRLEVGDVFTLEPGLYDPDAGWGVRLEDLLHLREDGVETLTPWPLDLDPRAWAAVEESLRPG